MSGYETDRRPVVVGVDGSPSSVTALRWAAREASMRGVSLRVVSAYHWDVPPVPGPAPMPDLQSAASAMQHEALIEVADDVVGVHIDTDVVFGSPAAVLLGAAKQAQLLVVGTHGHGALSRLVLGSVSHAVIQHAPCAVVVVPSPKLVEQRKTHEHRSLPGESTISPPLF